MLISFGYAERSDWSLAVPWVDREHHASVPQRTPNTHDVATDRRCVESHLTVSRGGRLSLRAPEEGTVTESG